MFCFIIRCRNPVIPEPHRQIDMGEPDSDIPVKIDGVQFNMRNGVE